MGVMSFLSGVGRQLNPLDNGATFKNPNGNGQNQSVATQVKNTATGFVKGAVQPFNFFARTDLINPVKEVAAQVTGNKEAYSNAVNSQFKGAKNAGQALRQIGGNAAQVGLTFLAPEAAKGIEAGVVSRVGEGVAAKVAGGAVAGAAVGAPFNVANTISSNEKLTPVSLIKSAAVGAGSGAVLGGATAGASEAFKGLSDRQKSIVNEQASKASGLKPDQVLNDNEAGTLSDFAQYKMQRGESGQPISAHARVNGDINSFLQRSQTLAKRVGIDISASPEEIHNQVADYLEARTNHIQAANSIAEGGYVKLPGNSDAADNLAKSSNPADIKNQISDFVAPNTLPTKADAIARTKDPNIAANIVNGETQVQHPAPPPTLPNPKDVKAAIDTQVQQTPPTVANPIGQPNPIQTVVESLKGGEGGPGIDKLFSQQSQLYSTERSTRLGRAQDTGNLTGREALAAQKSALSGKLPRVDSSALVDTLQSKVNPEQVNGILDHLRTTPTLSGYEPITAQNAITNLFDKGKLPTPNEFSLLEKSLGSDFTDQVKLTAVDSLTTLQKIKNFGVQVVGMPKAIMASLDFSGGGRQGSVLGSRFPEIWAKAQADSVKGFASSEFYTKQLSNIQDAINNGPRAEIYKNMDLNLASPGGPAHEEAYASNLAEKIPVAGKAIEASDRAYTLGLTEQRYASAEHVLDTLEKNGINPSDLSLKEQRDLGRVINTATGRGALGAFEKHAQSLGEALFSPRLWKSRLDMLNPVYYAKLSGPARVLALQSAASFMAVAGSILGLAVAAGAKVETDARSSDFLKVKVGDSRYDVLGGFQQNIVLLNRELVGQKKSSTTGGVTDLTSGKFGSADRLSILSDFVKNKENPVISAGQQLLKGTDQAGNKVNPASTIGNLFVPLNIQDTYKTAKNTGSLPKGLLKATLPGTVGVGVNTYGVKDVALSDAQKHIISKLTDKNQQEAYTRFFQVTKQAAGTRQNVSDAINQALSTGDTTKAQKLASDYNKSYASNFKDWSSQYSQFKSDKALTKDYNSNKINLTKTSIKTRLKAIKAKQ